MGQDSYAAWWLLFLKRFEVLLHSHTTTPRYSISILQYFWAVTTVYAGHLSIQ